jgi:uncharacterized protein YyaL (SSP411 family)
LGPEDGELFCRAYDVTPTGNFEGQTILNLPVGLAALADELGMPVAELTVKLGRARSRLAEHRETREPPFRDEKVLASWNAFALRALAEAGGALGDHTYVAAARGTGEFLLNALRHEGRLFRSWKAGERRIPGFLEDYAAVGNALLSLFEADLDPHWLDEARGLADRTLELFWDEEEGLFFDAPRDGEELIVRPREAMDNATPSGNSLAIEFLLRSAAVFGMDHHREVAVRALSREMEVAARFPSAFGRFLSALAVSLSPPLEVVLLGDPESMEMQGFKREALREYLPPRLLIGGNPAHLPPLPALKGKERQSGEVTAFVCRDFSCTPPISESGSLTTALGESVRPAPTGA